MEEKYKIYDNFLVDYLDCIDKAVAHWNFKILVRKYNEKKVEDIFLLTILERVLSPFGYDYKVEPASKNFFNFLKFRKKIGKDKVTRKAFEDYYGFYHFTAGYLEANKMMEKGYNYTQIRNLMGEILKEYYNVERTWR